MLRLRILSAVVLIPVVLLLLGLGQVTTTLLIAAVVGLALDEAYEVFGAAGHRPVRWAGFLSALLLVLAAWLLPSGVGIGGAVAAAVLITLTALLARQDRGGALTDWALTLAGPLYVAWTLSHFILMGAINIPSFAPAFWQALHAPAMRPGAWWVLTALLVVWVCDSAAYFIGMRWGRHKMGLVSPKKSWEGAAAGFLFSIGTAVGLKALLGLPISYPWAALLGALIGVVGQVGDLAESLLKRQANVKDSGHLIPGHGGMLDRIDSLLFVAPVVYYFLQAVLPGVWR
jgi:phosphatidate cytidylyltransferase